MTDVPDSAPLLEAAEQAVAGGDHATAERLLRELAASQEAALGPEHPDLAATLNNLAFVCEQTGSLEDAERNYRRARAIAVASLPPGHPFIATSLRNLMQFCAANGIPIFKPPAAPAAAEISDARGDTQADDVAAGGRQQAERAPPGRWTATTTLAAVALGVTAVAVVTGLVWRGITGTVEPVPDTPAPVVDEAPAPDRPAAAESVAPAPGVPASADGELPAPDVPASADGDAPAPDVPAPAPVEPPPPPAPRVAAAQVTVLRAQVCSDLERTGSPDWQCTPASGELEPGAYTFYTRVLTDVPTTVEHRWFHDDRVHQAVELDVTPSPGRGYRTFSLATIGPERAGDWRVEVRAADGTLLQEERFVVRRP
jgi:hypothetical protein